MIKEILAAWAKTQNKVWAHDRAKTIGASEIGQCARKINWLKTGVEPDEDQSAEYGGMMRGNVMENEFWVPAMRLHYGKNLLFAGEDQKTLISGPLSATPDGLVINQKLDALKDLGIKDLKGDCFVVECKSIDPRVTLKEEKDVHRHQVQVQLGAIREKTEYKPHYAVVSYMDASFWHEVKEYVIEFDPKIYENAKARAQDILSSPKQMAEGWIDGGKECESCTFTRRCGIVRKSLPESEAAANPQFIAEIVDLCTDYSNAKEEEKLAASRARAVTETIKDRLRDKSVRKIKGVVSWSAVKGRTSYDTDAMKKDGIDIEKYASTGEASDRLTISI